MAHCNFSSPKDAEIFAETKTSISHCPISNAYFANSVLAVKRLKSQGVNIGLATDISAGFSASIYDNIRQSVICSRILEDGVDSRVSKEKRGVDDSRVSVIEAFYLATTGGGKALGLPLGLIKEGYICDLQVVEMEKNKHSMFNSSKEMLQKVLYLTEKENIKQVWIQGKLVHEKI